MWKKLAQLKKLSKNKGGFTLTEVMIGIMILTVAIVSATNLLVGLISTNQNNMTSLKAYYLAQEGLEAVRNIRDTNWLHNQDWLGKESDELWGGHFEVGGKYSVNLEEGAFNQGIDAGFADNGNLGALNAARPWSISSGSNLGLKEKTDFKRTIFIKPYEDSSGTVLANYVVVESKVSWQLGSKDREVMVSTILTNWKGGAL